MFSTLFNQRVLVGWASNLIYFTYGRHNIVSALSQNEKWKADDIPDLIGKIAVVTGANSGTGFAATQALVRKKARVVMGCRNLGKAEEALSRIRDKIPDSSAEIIQVDLADLSSIRNFAQEFKDKYQSLHILLNNAGIMAPPKLKTVDGFELQFGTNHLGHFALTGLLMERITNTDRARVVTMSSSEHKNGTINFNDLQGKQSYSGFGAYAQSKLANILFAYELHRRLRAAGSTVLSLCSHPGGARTNLWNGLGRTNGVGLMNSILYETNNCSFKSWSSLLELLCIGAECRGWCIANALRCHFT